jgi:NADH-quinone oxidoreductase subunit N
MKAGLMVLIISMIINSVIGLYYYLRIITTLFSTASENKLPELSLFGNIALTTIAISILVLGIYPGWLIDIIVRFVKL